MVHIKLDLWFSIRLFCNYLATIHLRVVEQFRVSVALVQFPDNRSQVFQALAPHARKAENLVILLGA